MTTEAGGTTTLKKICPGPSEMIMHFFMCTPGDDDVITIPDRVSYVHDAWAVSNATSHGGAAALASEETTIEQSTYLDEVKFQAGNDEYLTGFALSDIDAADDVSSTGTAASDITYYKVAPGPSDGGTNKLKVVYFEGTVTSDEAISFDEVGIDKVIGAIAFSVSTGAFTATACTLGDSDELHKIKFTTGAMSDADIRGIAWGYGDKEIAAANTGTTLTEATGIKIWKLFPGPAEVNMTYFKNTEVSTNEGLTITGMTEARFAIAHKIAAGVSTINAVTVPTQTAGEEDMIKFTTANSDVDVRGLVIGDVGTPGWSS